MLDLTLDRLRRGVSGFDAIYMVDLVDGRYLVVVALGYHFVVEGPASTACEFGNNDIAVTQEVDVKVDVVNGLRNVSMAYVENCYQLTSRDM